MKKPFIVVVKKSRKVKIPIKLCPPGIAHGIKPDYTAKPHPTKKSPD